MKVEIKRWDTGAIIISGEYESIKDCLEKNIHTTNFYRASLDGVNLNGASLHGANLHGVHLDGASLHGTNLYGANLDGASLDGAFLIGASLDGASLNRASLDGELISKIPIQLLGLEYFVLITEKNIQIGCKKYTAKEWESFSDKEILSMDEKKGLDFWKKYKKLILDAWELHSEKEEIK